MTRQHDLPRHPAQVQGLNKAGKEFFKFAAASTDALRCLAVAERQIWAISDHQLSCWLDGAESWVYTCPDRIADAQVRARVRAYC